MNGLTSMSRSPYLRFMIPRLPARCGVPCSILALILLLTACNEDPGSIGSGYLPENVTFHTYVLQPQEFGVVSGIAAASNSSAEGVTQILAGEAPDGTIAYALIALTSVPGVLDDGIDRPVTSATFTVRAAEYLYGDTSAGRVALDLVVLDEVFAVNAKYSEETAAKVRNATVLGSVDTTYNDSGFVTFALDPIETARFVRSYFRWDTVSVINGVADRRFTSLKSLALRPGTGSRAIASFLGVTGVIDSLRPTLSVRLGDTTGIVRSGATNWIMRNDAPSGDGRFVLSAGPPIRSLLTFRLDSIPTSAVIHQAELRIHVVSGSWTHGTLPEPDNLVAYLAGDTSFSTSGYLTSSIGYLAVSRFADTTGGGTAYRITALGPIMTRWLRTSIGADNLPNRGLIVALNRPLIGRASESVTVDRMRFHGPDDPDPRLRPSLTVTYSVQSNANQ